MAQQSKEISKRSGSRGAEVSPGLLGWAEGARPHGGSQQTLGVLCKEKGLGGAVVPREQGFPEQGSPEPGSLREGFPRAGFPRAVVPQSRGPATLCP